MEKKFNYVYITTCLINNKQYVGSHCTNNINDSYIGSGKLFLKAVKKYKKENFKCEILENDKNYINVRKKEQKYIDKFNTLAPNGYNLSPTGGCELGFTGALSKEHKKKFCGNQKGKTYEERFGVEKAQIIKEKQRLKKIGQKQSQETINKRIKHIKGTQKGKTYEELYGREKANEMKRKQRESKLGTTTERKGKGIKNQMIDKYGKTEGLNRYREFIRKQRISHEGKVQSKETIEKRLKSMGDPWNKGKKYKTKPLSEEHKNKLRKQKTTKQKQLLNKLMITKIIDLKNKGFSYKNISKETGINYYLLKTII